MPVRRIVAFLLLLACALLAAPAASADPVPVPLPVWLHVSPGTPLDMGGGPDEVQHALEDDLERLLMMIEGPDADRMVDAETGAGNVTIECRVNEEGQTECRGVVCRGSGGEGDRPVTVGGDLQDGYVGVDATQNPDGSYGPYDTFQVSLGGNCGCTAWVQVLWPTA